MTKRSMIAAIDVGSHEICMKIAGIRPGAAPDIVETVRQTIPVGVDTYNKGEISQPVLDSCIGVLYNLMRKQKEYRISRIKAVATSAFREAANRSYAVEQIRQATGLEVEVVPNSIEMHLHLLAVAEAIENFLEMIESSTLLLDIGSGSIQLTLFDHGNYIFTQNIRLGSLRVRELLADLEQHTTDFNALMAEYISGDLNYYRNFEPRRTDYKNLIVIGSGVRFMRALGGGRSNQPFAMSRAAFQDILARLKIEKPLDLTFTTDIPTEHASLLLPAAIVIDEVFNFTGVDRVHLPNISLAKGILLDLARLEYNYVPVREPKQDTFDAAKQLARRYRTDRKHCEYVAEVAVKLFDLTSKLHNIDRTARRFLELGAILHNLGKYITMTNDGVRTYDIIMTSELIGLSDREKLIVALIACFHNGNVTPEHPMMASLNREDALLVCKLTALLALANSLDASHKQKIRLQQARLEERQLVLVVSAEQDCTLEIWNIRQFNRQFIKVFGLEPKIKLRRRLSREG